MVYSARQAEDMCLFSAKTCVIVQGDWRETYKWHMQKRMEFDPREIHSDCQQEWVGANVIIQRWNEELKGGWKARKSKNSHTEVKAGK